MCAHEITIEEKDRMLKCREMISSSDIESVELGITLADAEFGKYHLWQRDLSFHQIIKNEHVVREIFFDEIKTWLYFAAKCKMYLYYEDK